jgi:hypothetical protein
MHADMTDGIKRYNLKLQKKRQLCPYMIKTDELVILANVNYYPTVELMLVQLQLNYNLI